MVNEKNDYKSNNELYEMIRDLKETIISLVKDLVDTQNKVKQYNGLRESIHNLETRGCQKENEWSEVKDAVKEIRGFVETFEAIEKHRKESSEKTLKIIAVSASVSSFLLAVLLAFMKSGG